MSLPLSTYELSALIQVSLTVNAHLDLDTVLESVMTVTTDVMKVEASSLVLIDDETGDLLFHVAQGEKAKAIKTIRMKMGEGIVGLVAQTGNPIIVNNTEDDERFCNKVDKESGFSTKSILCVPLKTNNRLWGAIEVLNKLNGSCFDDSDLMLCEAIAAQAAIAVENAMLHKQIVKNERLAAIGQTVAGLAHCIKNVLNGIQGGSFLVDLGMRKNDQPRLEKGWEIVKKNMEFMKELVLDMLTYAKEREPEYELADMNEIIQSVCAMMEEKGREKGVKITTTPDVTLDKVVLDPQGIRRCLLNLISNSVDACENIQDAYVNVGVKSNGKEFSVTISDNGSGIPKEVQEKLFQMFFSTKGSKGTGIGLAVTHKIITEHKGRIAVDSEIGKGTTFIITLPLQNKFEDSM